MQMLDSKSDSQNSGGAQSNYNAPKQQDQGDYGQPQQQQSQSSYNAPQQQQSYQQPSYGGQQQQQKAPQQKMPEDLPSIDIDEDEIPF
jgi:single-strand DNA-binding protein